MDEEKMKAYFDAVDNGTLERPPKKELNEYYMRLALAGLLKYPRAEDPVPNPTQDTVRESAIN